LEVELAPFQFVMVYYKVTDIDNYPANTDDQI
jgi:hypothetical protein